MADEAAAVSRSCRRYRLSGLPFGGSPSLAAAAEPTSPARGRTCRGDPISTIDWRASARLSTARARRRVRRPRALRRGGAARRRARDRRPSMGALPRRSPWLSKPAVVRAADRGDRPERRGRRPRRRRVPRLRRRAPTRGGEPFWLAPQRRAPLASGSRAHDATAPATTRPTTALAQALDVPRRASASSLCAGHVRLRHLRLPRAAAARVWPG